MLKNFIAYFFLASIFTLFLSGCQSEPTEIPTHKMVPTLTPAQTRTPSFTDTKYQVQTSISPTWTQISIPTAPGKDQLSKVANLLKTNGNCLLPCWWGITPGQTTWQSASPYLSTVSEKISLIPSEPQEELTTFYQVEYIDPNSKSASDSLFSTFLIDKYGIIQIIDIVGKYPLSTILTMLGVPSEVRFNFVTLGPGPYDFTLIVFYKAGIMAVYHGATFSGNADFVYFCPKDFSSPNSELWVWNTSKYETFEDIGQFGVIPPLSPPNWIRQINDISDMQPQSFYDQFKTYSPAQCIKSPWSDWIK